MHKLGGTKSWVVTVGVTLLLAFLVVPALSGAASATSATNRTPSVAPLPWAYCGNGTWSHTETIGNASLAWNAVFAWCTIFHQPAVTAPGVWMLEVNRTLGMNISASLSTPTRTLEYHFAALEVDAAFANVTNGSTVYAAGQPVAALGLLNASAFDNSSLAQSFRDTEGGATASASLSVNGTANASVSFSPSLGLIPLNLTGVTLWNSTATATASAAWQVDWAWSHTPFNGTEASGSSSRSGNLSGTFTVNLAGHTVPRSPHPFVDGKARIGAVLGIQGPFDLRDGFVLVPHAFDLFGGAAQGYETNSMGSATVASGETLYFSPGPHGPVLSAAASSFGADDSTLNGGGMDATGLSPSVAGMNPGGTVVAQPVSVAQAQAESAQILGQGTSGTVAHAIVGVFLVGLVAAAVVVAILGVIAWRSRASRRASERWVSGYPGYGSNGVPPAVMAPPSPPPGPSPPVQGTEPREPSRPL